MLIEEVYPHLPIRIIGEIKNVQSTKEKQPEEIRLRANRCASLTYGHENIMLDTVITAEELKDIIKSICKNSVYAYKDSISCGYVSLGNGIRAGVCGSAFCENGKVSAVYDITSIVIRIPQKTENAASFLCDLLKVHGYKKSCLIYAASGEGKTTLLRSAAHILSSGISPLRVSVIDSREELGAFLGGSGLCVDILKGYPKEIGSEIAARTLNAQIIICDEIFGEKEATALAGAVNCGIPILCSAHAGSVEELLSRHGINTLHKQKVFDFYVRIRRSERDFVFDYDIKKWEEANNCLQSLKL